MNSAVPTITESETIDKYLDLARELKKDRENEDCGDKNCGRCSENCSQMAWIKQLEVPVV